MKIRTNEFSGFTNFVNLWQLLDTVSLLESLPIAVLSSYWVVEDRFDGQSFHLKYWNSAASVYIVGKRPVSWWWLYNDDNSRKITGVIRNVMTSSYLNVNNIVSIHRSFRVINDYTANWSFKDPFVIGLRWMLKINMSTVA